ncbi:hypothetical protein Lal_00017054 [Lupinus albus]|nr:hypothetical protein Lal_00017054 [Lupinus albus]
MWESEELTPPSFSLPKQWPHPKEEQDARDSAQPESVFSPTTKEAIHSGPSDPKVGGGVGGTREVAKNQTQHSPSSDEHIK